ncbi:MAG: M20/M25/M40 family metallo-hydrolase [Candidatus Thermoplasmatota archaeon]|jgi:hypothetical protein|nr:M20/M25/M40 family metallo-hydrolase [Candidatus Thermoplasmatota archaeon]
MKNKKYIIILLCTIIILNIHATSASRVSINKNVFLNFNEPDKIHLPGLINGNEPVIKVKVEKYIQDDHQKISSNIIFTDVIDLITQIDESTILAYLENLTSFGPRVTGEDGCIQAAEYIYNEFYNMGLEVRYQNWVYGGYNSNNIEATLPGINPDSDDIYIICAHYDTVPGSPGADDDGSGVAAVLAAAKVMSSCEFNNTIRFVTFSGEEEGLYGSYMYVQEAYNNGDDIKGVLNVDMIGFALNDQQASYLKVYEDTQSEWLYSFTSSINQKYKDYIDLELIHSGWSWGSDHYYFWEFGYNAIFYHEYEFNHYYHSPDDTIGHMNLTYTKKGIRLIAATLAELAQINSTNSRPEKPDINGPLSGRPKIEYQYTFYSIDPEGYNLYYYIEWGDATNTGWIGPFASGEEITINHSWSKKGDYILKAKAKDIFSAESEWGNLKISIPRTRVIKQIVVLTFLDYIIYLFPHLKNILLN